MKDDIFQDIVSLYSARSASSLARHLTGLQEINRVDPRTPKVEISECPPAVQLIEDQPTTSHAEAVNFNFMPLDFFDFSLKISIISQNSIVFS